MFDRFGNNPTQLSGLLSFAATTIACLIAIRRSNDARTWGVLALMNCLFLIEIFSGLRFHIHDLVDTILVANGWYAQRSWVQTSLDISVVTIVFVFMTHFIFRRLPAGRGARAAASITLVILAQFAMETVSLHALDAIFYQLIGPVLLIGWLWAITSAGICLASFQR